MQPVSAISPFVRTVPVLIGAADELVSRRKLRNKYETNRDIKTWSVFFLLKSLTTTGLIKNVFTHEDFLQMEAKTIRKYCNTLEQLQLAKWNSKRGLELVSYERAAMILGITYTGIINFQYDYSKHGKQSFQYFIRAQEIHANKEKQLYKFAKHYDNNPHIKQQQVQALISFGYDALKLQKSFAYFHASLLEAQKKAFAVGGTEIFNVLFVFRADLNRSCRGIARAHTYKAKQSASYLKKVLQQKEIVSFEKTSVISSKRTRFSIADNTEGGIRDGYKWLEDQKKTMWVLCDQTKLSIEFKTVSNEEKNQKGKRKSA